jgi:hypothetical protein
MSACMARERLFFGTPMKRRKQPNALPPWQIASVSVPEPVRTRFQTPGRRVTPLLATADANRRLQRWRGCEGVRHSKGVRSRAANESWNESRTPNATVFERAGHAVDLSRARLLFARRSSMSRSRWRCPWPAILVTSTEDLRESSLHTAAFSRLPCLSSNAA